MQPLRETHACGVPACKVAPPHASASVTSAPPVCAPHVAPLDPEMTPRTTATDETWRIFSHIRNGGAQLTKTWPGEEV